MLVNNLASSAEISSEIFTSISKFLKNSAARLALALSTPPTICGSSSSSFKDFPSAILSGQNAKKKCVPTFIPFKSFRYDLTYPVVEGETVDLNIKSCPFVKYGRDNSSALSICTREGFMFSSTGVPKVRIIVLADAIFLESEETKNDLFKCFFKSTGAPSSKKGILPAVIR